MVATKRPATYADLAGLPEHVVGEIIGGELYVSPRPASPHALAAASLAGDLFGPFHRGRGGPGGWWILPEPELHLGPDVLVPDLAGWRRERMPIMPDTAAFELSPDWVCEVASPSTVRLDRGRKMAVYARAGVAWLWIVHPLDRTLEVYRLSGGHWELVMSPAGEDKAHAPPFDAIEVDLAAWWLPVDNPDPAR